MIQRKKRPRKWLLAGVAVGLLILGTGFVLACNWRVAALAGLTHDHPSGLPHNQVGLVLGCSPFKKGGGSNPFFVHRMDAAEQLYKSRKIDYILVSGDNRRQEYDEPTEMRKALIERGIPAQRIVRDYAGFTTLDSVVRARKVFQLETFTIISQQFHNERALYLTRGYGIEAVAFNAPTLAVTAAAKTYVREMFARVRAVLDVHLFRRDPHFLGPSLPIPQPQ